MLYVNQQELTV